MIGLQLKKTKQGIATAIADNNLSLQVKHRLQVKLTTTNKQSASSLNYSVV